MAYDFTIRPSGPQIDISLFPNAASKGIAAGNAQPSTMQSILGGVKEGLNLYNQYQQVQQNENALAIQENQIAQLPVTNQLQEAQLQNSQAIAQMNTMQAAIASIDEDSQIKLREQELANKLAESIQVNKDIKNKELINSRLSSDDSQVQASVLQDPDLLGTIFRDPNLANSIRGALGDNPFADANRLNQIQGVIGFYKQQELELKKAEIDRRLKTLSFGDMDKTLKSAQDDGQLSYLQNSHGFASMLDLAQNATTVIAGTKNYKDGVLDTSKADKTQSELTVGPTKYDVLFGDKKSNIVLDETSNKNLQALQRTLKDAGLPVPTPIPNYVAPTPANVASTKPFSEALGVESVVDSGSSLPVPQPGPVPEEQNLQIDQRNTIVSQRGRELLSQAQNDPDLMNRLKAKGLLRDQGTPTPAPLMTPTVPAEVQATPVQTESPAQVTPPISAEPTSPATLKQNISFAVKSLPSVAKNYIEPPIVEKVLNEGLLRGLSPINQALVAVESGGNAKAKSKGSSATGYFQLTEDAAEDVNVDATIPEKNVIGGVKYFNRLLTRYDNAEIPALLAYNLGMGVVDSAEAVAGSYDYEDLMTGINYLKAHGFYPKVLTSKNVEIAKKYPLKVLAYKKVFETVGYV